jgi:hypothetical protein
VRPEPQKLKKFSGQLTKSLLRGSTIRADFGRLGALRRKNPANIEIDSWPCQEN